MDHSSAGEPQFVANNLALDFINTAYGPDDEPIEVLVDDVAVMHWLDAAGLAGVCTLRAPKGIAALAIALRNEARGLLAAGREGAPLRAQVVNQILEKGRPVVQLVSAADGAVLQEQRRDDSAESLLQPVAAALGALLCGGDLAHVRQCEADDCTLMFHDTTKSRRRRWCSMALCGNRIKVAAFRARKHVG